MNLEHLHIFLQVAQSGSFAGVARTRDVDPSSISRSIAQLEQGLGIRLFQRSTRTLQLTEAGALYRARVEPVVEELAHAQDEAAQLSHEPSGTLRLAASIAFGTHCLVPVLNDFRNAHPMLSIDLVLSDDTVDLIENRIDLAIRLGPTVTGDLIATKLMPTRYRIVASRGWLQRHGSVTEPSHLAAIPCLRFDYPGFHDEWMFKDSSGILQSVPVTGELTISSAVALREAALADLGPALLADWMVGPDLRSGALVDLFPDHAVAATSFDTAAWIVYPSRAFLPGKARVMIDFLKANVTRTV